mgnify:CR=1 FL=1
MQKTITLRKAVYAYGEKTIFDEVSFSCSYGERLCILGENGVGKSTLLRILTGELELESGAFEKTGHIRSVYVPQEFPPEYKDLTVEAYIEKLGGKALFKKVYTISEELGFEAERYASRLCKELSGGQQKIVALSIAFASSPDFIMLDEPENHIDIVSRIVLIRMLQAYKGGIIFISHDRLIIDAIATKVAELAQGKLHMSEGDYQDYIKAKMERIGGLQRKYDTESKRIKQLSENIVILRQKAHRGKEVSAYHKTKDELDELKKAHKESGRPDDRKTKIRIAQSSYGLHGGKLLCRIKDAFFRYPGARADMFRELNVEARTPGHIVLLGRNGTGKSTFLKCLTGELKFSKGEIAWGNAVKWGYFDQHAQFDPRKTPLAIVKDALNLDDQDAKAVLGSMRFNEDRMKAAVGTLSGGEKMRVRFALVFGSKAEFIILDEPTNHLDEVTWEILLAACKNSKSTLLLVSHDYEFIEEFDPSVFWMIQGQTIVPRYKELSQLLEEMGA